VGKTTFAKRLGDELGIRTRHTDDLIKNYDWSSASAEVATWFDEPGPWIIEGVAVARAVRKWLATHPEGRPAETLYLATDPREQLSIGQAIMTRGHHTVWREIRDRLESRGLAATPF
jgi:adenylate kinase family enzyme